MVQLQRLAVHPQQIESDRLQLTDRQQHYLMRVLRLQAGDRFIALNGAGQSWMAVLQDKGAASLLESIAAPTELPIAVTLLIALPKTGMDDIVRQTTELGVSQIVPILSARSLLNPSGQKRDRWQRIAQEAAEQSERQIIPTVSPLYRWQEALQIWQGAGCYLCEARDARLPLLSCLKADLRDRANFPSAITLAVGPEGGWTEIEVQEAIAAGFQSVSLGRRILRAVTAPIAALSLIGAVLEANELSLSGNPESDSEQA